MMARWAEPIHNRRLHLRRASRPLILDHAASSRCEGIVEGALERDSQSFGPFRNSECVPVGHTLEISQWQRERLLPVKDEIGHSQTWLSAFR
jgi:hypothetical protein